MLNIQPIEKQDLSPDPFLQVHSIFPTIQGEGPFVGYRAIFVRLAGCNLQCPNCDTDYTSKRDFITPLNILNTVNGYTGDGPILVVITGGEPFRQPLKELTDILLGAGHIVQIETNGTLFQTLDYSNSRLTIVCSPKTGKVNDNLKQFIGAYKYVVSANNYNEVDGLPLKALGHPAHPMLARPHEGFKGNVYIQPEDEKSELSNERNLETAIGSCISFGTVLGLQVHKVIGLD